LLGESEDWNYDGCKEMTEQANDLFRFNLMGVGKGILYPQKLRFYFCSHFFSMWFLDQPLVFFLLLEEKD